MVDEATPGADPAVVPAAPVAPTLESTTAELTALRAEHAGLLAKFGDGKTIPDWMQRRIDAEVGRRGKAVLDFENEVRSHQATRSQLQLASAELAQLRGNPTPGSQPAGAVAPAGGGGGGASPPAVSTAAATAPSGDFEQRVQQEAQRRVAEQAALSAEAESATRGKAAYEDFTEVIGNLKSLGDLPPYLVSTAMETGGAEHVLYKLGKDLDLASRIAGLSPTKMAIEMSKLAEAPVVVAPAKASKAAAPMTPVGGKGSVEPTELRDDLPYAEWQRRRNAQVRAATRH